MLQTYKNETDMIRHFIDVNGDPHEAGLGETISYLDQHSTPSTIDGLTMKVETDANDMPVYIGYAKPGTAADEYGWAIKKRVVVDDVETWPWAGDGFVLRYRWDQRDSLDY